MNKRIAIAYVNDKKGSIIPIKAINTKWKFIELHELVYGRILLVKNVVCVCVLCAMYRILTPPKPGPSKLDRKALVICILPYSI